MLSQKLQYILQSKTNVSFPSPSEIPHCWFLIEISTFIQKSGLPLPYHYTRNYTIPTKKFIREWDQTIHFPEKKSCSFNFENETTNTSATVTKYLRNKEVDKANFNFKHCCALLPHYACPLIGPVMAGAFCWRIVMMSESDMARWNEQLFRSRSVEEKVKARTSDFGRPESDPNPLFEPPNKRNDVCFFSVF